MAAAVVLVQCSIALSGSITPRIVVSAARVPPAVMVEAIDAHSCFASVGSDTPRMLAFWLAMVDEDFEAGDHAELAEALRALAERYLRAAGA